MQKRKFEFLGIPTGVKTLTEAKRILGKKSVDKIETGHSVEFQGVSKKQRNPVAFKIQRIK
jgi:hypothetical protein